MVIYRSTTYSAMRRLSSLGTGLLGVVATVTGTALLMAAFSAGDDAQMVDAQGRMTTVADVVMESATERALVSPQVSVLAYQPNDRRGL